MSVFSTTASGRGPRHIWNWLRFHFSIYLAVAIASAFLFFAGAFLYAQFRTVTPPPAVPEPSSLQHQPQQAPLSAPYGGALMVELPSGQTLPFEELEKRTVSDKAGNPVGYVVGLAGTSNTGQSIVLAIQDNGSNKTVGLPTAAFTWSSIESKKALKANLPREAIVASPTFVNLGGVWKPTDEKVR